ncbi:ROK family protein [Ursidibacter sp. B-7004-1]
MKTASNDYKYQHLGQVYQLIEQFELISRTDIAKLSGYAPASITGLTKILIDNRLVLERTAQNLPSRGRPAVGLSLSPFHWNYLCITISSTTLSIFLCELSGKPIYQAKYPLPDNLIIDKVLLNALDDFLGNNPIDDERLCAVSVSIVGKLDKTKNIITQLGNYSLHCNLREILEKRLNKPILINEHFQLWLLAESTLGSLISHDDVIFLQLDDEINLSVLLRGELLHKNEYKRMNVDRMVMPKFSELSDIVGQNLSDIERYQLINQITFSALEKLIDYYYPDNRNNTLQAKIDDLCQAILEDNSSALLILEHICDNLSYVLLNLISIFSTEKIMLCSPLVSIKNILFTKIEQKITASLRQEGLNIDLVTSQYEWDSPEIPSVAIKYEIYNGNLIQNIIQL